ncbi:SNARE complex subunit [Metarhizium album ARSEF 1941]|uniref:SNARE complex subunit n=1 Tax=Metarhizium album (strain ARSEF 1941) TaxID=1081103 RepID=A0A0B2WLZ9_METAS|nr:SNARE complex subunit [Metarhizium album ARSEF 1941]KHN97081.1 SNARE complex subunit [Metarhizium album ARSEF 1941]
MAPPPEIAIPSTSVSEDVGSKPYTLYNITLRLPLRSFVVQKRYSDFAKLHNTLVQQVGVPPPEPLPGKHWLKSTVRSPDLARDRQIALEKYLRTIAETPDRRWRDTSAWRAFLNLPSASTTSSAVSAAGMVRPAATGAADPQTWLDMYRELKQHLNEARQCLSRRDAASDTGNSKAAAEAGAAAGRVLLKAGTTVTSLSDGLRKIQESNRLGEGELRRRRDLVSNARMERDALEKLSTTLFIASSSGSHPRGSPTVNTAAAEKATSFRSARPATGRVLGAPLPETAQTRELDNEGVLQLQKREMAAQDEAVDKLADIIRRQKAMGIQIKNEVDAQSEMLAALDSDVDRVNDKLGVARNRIKKL